MGSLIQRMRAALGADDADGDADGGRASVASCDDSTGETLWQRAVASTAAKTAASSDSRPAAGVPGGPPGVASEMSYRGEGATFVGVDGAPPLPLPEGVSGGAGLPKSWPRMTEEVWWPHARATTPPPLSLIHI